MDDTEHQKARGKIEVATYIDGAVRSLDVAIFVGGSLLQSRYQNLLSASERGVRLRFLIADPRSGWADELARPFALGGTEYAKRIYISASRARMLSPGSEVRWQPFPIPWSFVLADDNRGYVKAIDFVASGSRKDLPEAHIAYYRTLFDYAWSMGTPVDRLQQAGDVVPARATLRVFLCHASEDKEAVRDLHRRLSRDAVSPWLDEEQLRPGQLWEEEIPRAIRQADVFVVCMSSRSVAKRGFLQREIRMALQVAEEMPSGTIFIVPARLDDCLVPENLQGIQRVDLFKPEGYDTLLRALRVTRGTADSILR